MEYQGNNLNNNIPKKSGKAGLIVLIIFLLLVIVALVVLFVFKEKIFPVARENVAVDSNTLISNTLVENTTNTINETAQRDLINSVKGYWIATTGDLFLAITDNVESSSTNFSLTGSSGLTSAPCTIDSEKITCSDKIYNYKMQGNYLILSYDNITRSFVPSNYYQLSKQSKNFYANMMGYQIPDSKIPTDAPITGDYINKSLLGTWQLSNGNSQLVFSIKNGNLVVSKVNLRTRETVLDLPVGMNTKYIDLVNSSSIEEEAYSYSLKDDGTLFLSSLVNKSIEEYKKISNDQTIQITINN